MLGFLMFLMCLTQTSKRSQHPPRVWGLSLAFYEAMPSPSVVFPLRFPFFFFGQHISIWGMYSLFRISIFSRTWIVLGSF